MKKGFKIPVVANFLLLVLGLFQNKEALGIVEEATNTIRSERCNLRRDIYSIFYQEELFILLDKEIKNNGSDFIKINFIPYRYRIQFFFLEFILRVCIFIRLGFIFSLITTIEIFKERLKISRRFVNRRSGLERRVSSSKERLRYGLFLSIKSSESNVIFDDIYIAQSFREKLVEKFSLEISKYVFTQKISLKRVSSEFILEKYVFEVCEQLTEDCKVVSIDQLVDQFVECIFEEFRVDMLDRRVQLESKFNLSFT